MPFRLELGTPAATKLSSRIQS